jgi:hypothetical protein
MSSVSMVNAWSKNSLNVERLNSNMNIKAPGDGDVDERLLRGGIGVSTPGLNHGFSTWRTIRL